MSGLALHGQPLLATSHRPEPAGIARAQAPPKMRRAKSEPPLGGEEAARFRAIALPHLDAAYAFARSLCRDATLADDIVQDAYLRAYRGFGGYRGGSAKAWLFAIVRSSFLTWARSRKNRLELTDDEDALDQVVDDGATPEGLVLREAADAAVRAAVEALPDPFREAIVLREFQDLSYKEISEITSVPIGTVMSRLARARRLLAIALAGEAG